MTDPLMIARGDKDLFILPSMANRHGLVAGATGTGKTVTLQVLAESFSRIGVPVFMADIKGDLSGISQPGTPTPRIMQRAQQLGFSEIPFSSCPTMFWDVFGQMGHPVRATISEMGPLLLARLLDLNETQTGVLNIVFRVADDNGLLLLDLKDLRAMIQFMGDNSKEFTTSYGNISPASIGAIQRGLLSLEDQGGDIFFGEPALDLADLMAVDPATGKGVVNILAADKLVQSPKLYATFLLWLLAELFEHLPEAGDMEKPKLVFFFDEAHLLFKDAPKALTDKVEQVVRLIRSKGVGVYFITQNPLDVPEAVLGQLGNRVQHALRAFTPKDQLAVRTAAQTFRPNPALNTESAITELGIGEALISFLDEKGSPGIVEKAFVLPPCGQIGPITPDKRSLIIKQSPAFGKYENAVDRESAYEVLKSKTAAQEAQRPAQYPSAPPPSSQYPAQYPGQYQQNSGKIEYRTPSRGTYDYGMSQQPRTARRGRQSDSMLEAFGKSTARSVGNTAGKMLLRGIFGTLFGSK